MLFVSLDARCVLRVFEISVLDCPVDMFTRKKRTQRRDAHCSSIIVAAIDNCCSALELWCEDVVDPMSNHDANFMGAVLTYLHIPSSSTQSSFRNLYFISSASGGKCMMKIFFVELAVVNAFTSCGGGLG